MSDLDRFDDDLADALQRRAGPLAGSVADARRAVIARAGRARRRRAVAAGGGAVAALAVAGIVLLPGGRPGTIAPADSGEPVPSIERPTTTTDVDEGAVTTTTILALPVSPPEPSSPVPVPSVTSPRTTAAPTMSTTSAPAATPPSTPTSAPTSAPSSASTTVPTSEATTAPTPPSTSGPEPPAAFTRTYESLGGSITVSWDGSRLALLEVAPRPGFLAEVKDETASRVRVDFDDGASDSRIEVRRDGNDVTVTIS